MRQSNLEYPNPVVWGSTDQAEPKQPSAAKPVPVHRNGTIPLHIFPYIGDKRINDLKPIDLRNLYTQLTEKGLCLRTVRYAHFLIKSALNTAVQMELASRNVAQIIKPEGKHERKEKAVWSADDVQAFLQAARDDRLYALFYLLLNTGLRRGEVLALRWTDLNLRDKTLHVRRTLHISDDVIHVLRQHRANQEREYQLLGDAPDDDLIFTTQLGTPIHPDKLRRTLRTIARKASIEPITIHGLRHTYTSLAMSQTHRPLPVKVISRRLGHADVGFTLRIYQHIYDAQLEDAALTMEELTTTHAKHGDEPIQDVDWHPAHTTQESR